MPITAAASGSTSYIPMRWPGTWSDPGALKLLKNSGINCLLFANGQSSQTIAAQARQAGLQAVQQDSLPAGISVVKGLWPGVKLTESGRVDRASAGPTGDPWVDSNGWKVRLSAALHPDHQVWVDAAPPAAARLHPESYSMAIADAAVYGGAWIITLDEQLAAGIVSQQADALAAWNRVCAATRFFAAHQGWTRYQPAAVVGVISDFAGKNQFLSSELVNLIARTNQQYRIIPKQKASPAAFAGLRTVMYVDADTPPEDWKKQILAFVQAGGLLITGPAWGAVSGPAIDNPDFPGYLLHSVGTGRIAVSKAQFKDPYILAQDSVVLTSHRHDLLRFWNGGAVGSFLTMDPGGQRAALQMLFYAGAHQLRPTVRVAGRYRAATLSTIDQPTPQKVETEFEKDSLELHLPPLSQYAAVELAV